MSHFEPCRCGRVKGDTQTMCDDCHNSLPATLKGVAFWRDVLNPTKRYLSIRYRLAQRYLEGSRRFTTSRVTDWSDAKEVFTATGSPYPSGLVDRLRVRREV